MCRETGEQVTTTKGASCVTHSQQHFDPRKGTDRHFAWCETHGRLGAKGKPVKTATAVFTDEDSAFGRALAHATP